MNNEAQGLAELGALVTAFGLLLWLVRRTFTVTIPRLADTFKEEIAETRREHREDRESWRSELKEQRREFLVALERQDAARERARLKGEGP